MTNLQVKMASNKLVQKERMLKLALKTLGLTILEAKVIKGTIENEYTPCNGAEPKDYNDVSGVWSDCLNCNNVVDFPKGKVLSGVVSSLSKKSLIWVGSDSIGVTEECFNMYKHFNLFM